MRCLTIATMKLVTTRGGQSGLSTSVSQKVTTSRKNDAKNGPYWPFTGSADAAAQLHETGHSRILQHSSVDEGLEAYNAAFRGTT